MTHDGGEIRRGGSVVLLLESGEIRRGNADGADKVRGNVRGGVSYRHCVVAVVDGVFKHPRNVAQVRALRVTYSVGVRAPVRQPFDGAADSLRLKGENLGADCVDALRRVGLCVHDGRNGLILLFLVHGSHTPRRVFARRWFRAKGCLGTYGGCKYIYKYLLKVML